MADEQWFYCLKHNRVEPWDGCRSADRADREWAEKGSDRDPDR